jgi:glycosyltransferase involved in cell wall biosynthesis
MTTRMLQVDLSARVPDRADLAGYDRARIVLRYGPAVVGEQVLPVEQGSILGSDVRLAAFADEAIRHRISAAIVDQGMRQDMAQADLPSWSVVVCTRDRPHLLRGCLESLIADDIGSGEIIVVDNAPSTDATQRLVAQYPVRYAREDRRGLNRARSRGARIATGDIVIYADDDTIAERGWIAAILREFANPRVGAVTGLTMPFELETQAQELFERYGGFGKGFDRRVFDYRWASPPAAGASGSGANMAFRRELIVSKDLFGPALDLGTPARTGGDTYALYRVLADGYQIVYTPDALNWHRHRRDHEALRQTLYGYGTGLYACLTKALVEHRDIPALRVGFSFFRKHHLRELVKTLTRRRDRLPLDLVMAEIRGTLKAPIAYAMSRRTERARVAELEPVLEGEPA